MTKYRRMRVEAGWDPKAYLAEAWGYDSIEDVSSDDWDAIEKKAKGRWYYAMVLVRARRRYLKNA